MFYFRILGQDALDYMFFPDFRAGRVGLYVFVRLPAGRLGGVRRRLYVFDPAGIRIRFAELHNK